LTCPAGSYDENWQDRFFHETGGKAAGNSSRDRRRCRKQRTITG
jgi:hypothetical protein